MKDKIFIDTNVLIYCFKTDDEEKRDISKKILAGMKQGGHWKISYQIIQEVSNILLKYSDSPMKPGDLKEFLKNLLIPRCEFYPDPDFYLRVIDLKSRLKYSYYDSMVLLAALDLDCRYLFSEDLQDGQKVDNLTIVNPYLKKNSIYIERNI